MKFSPVTDNEASHDGFTHRLDFDYHDIPAGIANNTSKVWAAGFLPAVVAGDIVVKTELHLTTPFQDISDAAFNSSSISLGDATTATRFINASEANLNGTEVLDVIPGANQNVIIPQPSVATDAQFDGAKSLSDLDKGQGYISGLYTSGSSSASASVPFSGADYHNNQPNFLVHRHDLWRCCGD